MPPVFYLYDRALSLHLDLLWESTGVVSRLAHLSFSSHVNPGVACSYFLILLTGCSCLETQLDCHFGGFVTLWNILSLTGGAIAYFRGNVWRERFPCQSIEEMKCLHQDSLRRTEQCGSFLPLVPPHISALL